MTHLIKFKYLFICLFIYLFIGCKKNEHNADDKVNKEINLNGNWVCSNFEKEQRINSNYSVAFANETQKYSNFRIKEDSIYFGSCSEKFYKYSYSLNKKKYDDESVFITHFKPDKPSVDFLTLRNASNSCLPIDSPVFYIYENKLVILDRGYFFTYNKTNKQKSSYSIIGIPGNNRNYWEVKGTYENTSMTKAYSIFLTEFEFGSENLLKVIPDESQIDKDNNIEYLVKGNYLKIEKSDPLGTIYIEFIKDKNNINFTYRLDYPEY